MNGEKIEDKDLLPTLRAVLLDLLKKLSLNEEELERATQFFKAYKELMSTKNNLDAFKG
ncbi:hypothetical protein FACS1894211_05210 [Clostridia bacterium]|nr:hypothetical protein FACS1894211_05210 [Clostridia bacterium]